ncbi:trypsin 5G1-like [Anopheles funestus]|uniref:trypsin 5G1-like n=1 Tax=Anopheles funestus TaxID=62324 RepID=UPI0020C6230B|nr:trypsin 5G1-like [Anopheles funestus]
MSTSVWHIRLRQLDLNGGPLRRVWKAAQQQTIVIKTFFFAISSKITSGTVMVRANSSFFNRGGKLHRVERVIKHELFSYETGDYDFGLLRLKQRFKRGSYVKLASGRKRFPPAERCTAMGWGYTLGPASREQLRQVVLPIVSQKVCQKSYEKTDKITARMLCAGYTEGMQDACDVSRPC